MTYTAYFICEVSGNHLFLLNHPPFPFFSRERGRVDGD